MRWKNEQKRYMEKRAKGRQLWFAWYPVQTDFYWHWLEYIWREYSITSYYYYRRELYK